MVRGAGVSGDGECGVNINDLKQALAAHGFGIQSTGDGESPWVAYRRTHIPARSCECNSDKRNVQVVVRPTEFQVRESEFKSAAIDVTGEFGGRWFKLECYGVKYEEVLDSLPEIERALVRAWNALA